MEPVCKIRSIKDPYWVCSDVMFLDYHYLALGSTIYYYLALSSASQQLGAVHKTEHAGQLQRGAMVGV